MAQRYNNKRDKTCWRHLGKVLFWNNAYSLWLSNDGLLWGYSRDGRDSAAEAYPALVYLSGKFGGIHIDFVDVIKPVLEAAMLGNDPSVSPNARAG